MDTVKTIPIFYACDNKYAPMAAASMASVLFNTTHHISFYILDCGMAPLTRRKLEMLSERFSNFSLEFISVDSDTTFGHIELRNYLTTACFARFLIPDVKPELDKVIYLDCDTIIFRDIADLYNQNLGRFAMGAVPDPNVFGNPTKKSSQYAAAMLTDGHLYFNSGVMLMSCAKWRSENILAQLIESERKTSATRYFNDQDVLNNTFNENYMPLDVRFNVKSNLVTHCAQEDIVVRHYTVNIKPWLKMGFTQLHAHDFWFYCQMTAFFAETLVNGLTELGMVAVTKVVK